MEPEPGSSDLTSVRYCPGVFQTGDQPKRVALGVVVSFPSLQSHKEETKEGLQWSPTIQ